MPTKVADTTDPRGSESVTTLELFFDIVFAAGMHRAIVTHNAPDSTSTAVLIAGGVSAYLIGLAGIRWMLRIGPPWTRIGCAALALPCGFVGAHWSPQAELTVLGTILVLGIVVGRRMDHAASSPG